MLHPLPELDVNFAPFDTALEAAVDAVCPVVLPVPDCQSDGLSHTAVLRGDDGDAAVSHFILDCDEAFSNGSDSSPGGFRKRHNLSPFRQRADKKSLQIPKGRGHERSVIDGGDDASVGQPLLSAGQCAQHGSSDTDSDSDSVIGQPVLGGCASGQSDGVVSLSVFPSHERNIGHGSSTSGVISRPILGRGRNFRHASSDVAFGQLVPQPAFDMYGAAWGDVSGRESGQLGSWDQRSSSASFEHPPEMQCPQCEPAVMVTASDAQLTSDSAVYGTAAADLNAVSHPLECCQSNVIRRGGRRRGRLFHVIEPSSSDIGVNNSIEQQLCGGDVQSDNHVELIEFDRPTMRCVLVLTYSFLICCFNY